MFLNSWRWRGSAVDGALQISVSGMPITLMSGRNFDGGSGRVLS
jgi:allophanate hydrolase subunit 2